MIIEKLQKKDINQLKEIYKQLVPFENSLDDMVKLYNKMINDDRYYLAVAKDNDKLVGTALGVICDDLALSGRPFMVIESVVVDENYRGMGIGREIFEKLDEFARKNNACDCLVVSSGNRKIAHKFYYDMGFTDDVRGFRKIYK